MAIVKKTKKNTILAIAILTFLVLCTRTFGQTTNVSLSGTIQDPDKLVVPGVTVTATNVDTEVTTTVLSNNSGVYNFPSLQPGLYTISAKMDGFQINTKTDVDLTGVAAQHRLDFDLAVAGLYEELEVTTTAQDILTASNSSTGTVLRSQELIDLPLTSNNVMELVNIMGGVQPSQELFDPSAEDEFDSRRSDQSFAGVDTNAIHIQQDGITINDVRYATGIASSSRINTEMVSEFKLILSPVDAEMGRGMGQVQILTKSGANTYHGSGVWNITNSALDANTWDNNRQDIPLEWRNLNTYMLTFSGPIIKNKTFFFVTWDHAIPRTHTNAVPIVLTNCARKGIYRYFNGWNSGHNDADVVLTGATPTKPVVDINGVPLDPRFADQIVLGNNEDVEIITLEPDGETPSSLQYVSVFGPLTAEAQALVEQDMIDCSAYDPYSVDGNPYLYDMSDPTSAESLAALGIERYWEQGADLDGALWRIQDMRAIRGFSDYMPRANSFRDAGSTPWTADGLNYAVHRWTRADKGVDRIHGVGQENARKNITFKIDHNFSDRHRASGTYTYERDFNAGAQKYWPNGFAGTTERTPQRFSISLISSLRPTLLNEARFGLNRNNAHSFNAIDATETRDEVRALMQSMIPTEEWENYPKGEPFMFNPQRFWANNYHTHFIGGADRFFWHSFLPSWGGWDHRWTMADTLTWVKGRHSLKFGGDIRLTRSHQDADGDVGQLVSRPSLPVAYGGIAEHSLPYDLDPSVENPQIPGLVGSVGFLRIGTAFLNLTTGTTRTLIDLRDYMAGSIGVIYQWFFIQDPFDKDWNDINEGEINRILDIRQKEFAFFAKDDWKVSSSLTLNLGLRYEYYGVPWLDRGMTLGLKGGANALFGVTGRDFSTWMAEQPVNLEETLTQEEIDAGITWLTQQEFIGPGSPQPGIGAFYKDVNNFGPAVGFAWQIPWFGKGKTTVRGGYQLSYSQIANADISTGGFSNVLAGSTGTNFEYYYFGDAENNPYMRFADLDSYLPVIQYIETEDNPPRPLSTLHIENRGADLTVYDPDIVNPYTQSLNLSVSRNIGSHVTLDVRYIGTLARKGVASLDLNEANWINNGLKEAFDYARRGDTHPLLDRLFEGIQFNMDNSNPVGVGGPTGGEVLRNIYSQQLVEGDYNAVANGLNILNYQRSPGGWDWGCWCVLPSLNMDLPSPGQLEDGMIMRHANMLYPGQFPENFIVANPQLRTANWYTNLNHNNYHSMQVQFTVRPTHGFNMTATYTWAKNLGNGSYTNPNDRANPFDYTWTGNSRQHQLNTYGALTLPFGANGLYFRDIGNAIARRFIEGWQLSWILSMNSGGWQDLTADATHLYGNSVPDIVRPEWFDGKGGHVEWAPGARNGYYFGDPDQYMFGPDPQCFDTGLVDESLQQTCMDNMSALYIPMYDEETGDPVYSQDNVIFQHPLPGEYGSYGRNKIRGIGSFSLDMAMGKTFQLAEGKSISFRMDAGNILNHPSPDGFSAAITQDNPGLGIIDNKIGNRRFQAKLTIRF